MTIEKFDKDKHSNLAENLDFAYESAVPYLDFAGFVLDRNGHKEIVSQDLVYPNSFPYLYVPHRDNWNHSQITFVTAEQVEELKQEVEIINKIPLGEEFLYHTKDFIEMGGQKWATFRRHVNRFEKDYKYKLNSDYPLEKVKQFSEKWLASQKEKTQSFQESYDFFNFCLNHMKKYKIKALFVEVNSELVGLAMGVDLDKDKWVGLHLKVDYKYKGLSRFLHHKRAELFKDKEFFTLGSSGHDVGIEKFKKEINPYKLIHKYYVVTGNKLSNKQTKTEPQKAT